MSWVKLDELPLDLQERIAALVAAPTPPRRWLDLGVAQIPSRAFHEWYWQRGRRPPFERRSLPPLIREAVIGRDGLVCGLCGFEVELDEIHIDHVIPVALGGSDALDNLQVAHSQCNLRKGARI